MSPVHPLIATLRLLEAQEVFSASWACSTKGGSQQARSLRIIGYSLMRRKHGDDIGLLLRRGWRFAFARGVSGKAKGIAGM